MPARGALIPALNDEYLGYASGVSSDGESPAAGWYQNAEGKRQWWDGSKWGPLAPDAPANARKAPPANLNPPVAKKKPGFFVGCLVPVLVVLALLTVFVVMSNTPDAQRERAERDAPVLAELACERAVKAQLKSPASAEFGSTSVSGSGAKYTVAGTVDAENSFGALMRNSFVCEVEVEGGRASVIDLAVG